MWMKRLNRVPSRRRVSATFFPHINARRLKTNKIDSRNNGKTITGLKESISIDYARLWRWTRTEHWKLIRNWWECADLDCVNIGHFGALPRDNGPERAERKSTKASLAQEEKQNGNLARVLCLINVFRFNKKQFMCKWSVDFALHKER